MSKRFSSNGWQPRDWSRFTKITDLNLNRDAYFTFHALAYYLEKTYGLDKYLEIGHELGKGTAPDVALKKIYGKNETELMTEYKTFFEIK